MTEERPQYVTVSFSGGKDSTAMLLHMVELGEHIDEVLTCDTGMEFPAMYEHIARVHAILDEHGIKHTVLKAPHPFEWYMFEKEIPSDKYGLKHGFGWPTPMIRWCTGWLKRDVLTAHLKEIRKDYDLVQCIGLAADEVKRLERDNNTQKTHRHPLVEWGWTEADCLQYCYDRGFDWGGLYKIFHRVSCWCCPLQAVGELRNLWKYYPELWAKLEEMDERLRDDGIGYKGLFKRAPEGVKGYAKRFEKEARAERAQTTLISYIEEGEE